MRLAIFIALFYSKAFALSYLPTCDDGQKVAHQYYTLCYSENHEQSFWVAYRSTIKSITGPQKRTNNFRADSKIITGSSVKEDYKESGFDRGHLVPAADMRLNYTSMSQSFFMSNISPQVAGFNRGVWSRIENEVRRWTKTYGELYIVTGPVLEPALPVIGRGVSVPRYFYKIIFDNTSKKPKMLAFLIENKSDKRHISEFVTTVDEIESMTKIDFFTHLPIQRQAKLESFANYQDWIASRN